MMDQWTQTSIKSGFVSDSESSVVNGDVKGSGKRSSKPLERGKENRGFFPNKTHLGFRTSAKGDKIHKDDREERESWINRAKTVYNSRKSASAKSKKPSQNGTKNNSAWGMSAGCRKHFSPNRIVTVDSHTNATNNRNGTKTGGDSLNSHFTSSTRWNSKGADPKKALEISLSLGVNGAHDHHKEHVIYNHNDDYDDDFHHHHHYNDDDDVNYYSPQEYGEQPPSTSPPRFFSPRYDAGARRGQRYGRNVASANSRKLGQLPSSSSAHPPPGSAPPRHCDACAVDYVRKWFKTNPRALSVAAVATAENNGAPQTANGSNGSPLAFHEPLQLMYEDEQEPNQIYMLTKEKTGTMATHPREKVSIRTVSLPRRGRIKLTALPYELDNPEYFDDRKAAAERRDLVTQYKEQLMGPALPNPSPDGSLIRNRSILKQVKSDVKRMEKEREQEAQIRRAMEGRGITSLVEDLLKYEMTEVPNINSTLQQFVTKVQPKTTLDMRAGTITTISTTNNNNSQINADKDNDNNTEIPHSGTPLSKQLPEEYHRKRSIRSSSTTSDNDDNPTTEEYFSLNTNPENPSFYNHPHQQRSETNTTIQNLSISINKNNKIYNNGGDNHDDNGSEEDMLRGTPRSLPDINASASTSNKNTQKNKNKDNKTAYITTPRKEFEDVIRRMEASNNFDVNNNSNDCNKGNDYNSTIPNKTQSSPSPSPYNSPRSTLWYNHPYTTNSNNPHQPHKIISPTEKLVSYTGKISANYEPTPNLTQTDELSLHCIVKNAQKITSHQLRNHQHKHGQNSRQSTILDFRRK